MMRHAPSLPVQFLAVALLTAVFIGAAVVAQLGWHSSAVYTHLAYLPLVFATLWWGARGLLLLPLLGSVILLAPFIGAQTSDWLLEVLRLGSLVLVGVVLAILRERLRSSLDTYRMLLDRGRVGIVVYRGDTILLANSQLASMLACSPSELVGECLWNIFHPADISDVRQRVAIRPRDGVGELRYEARLVTRAGEALSVEVTSFFTEYDGARATLVMLHDVTARANAERKERELSAAAAQQEAQLVHSTRLAEMGEMAAAVAHELNQPLTVIKNFAKNSLFILEHPATLDPALAGTEEVKENLRLISGQVTRASKIIKQMRELARRDNQEQVLVDIHQVIEEIVGFLGPQLALADIQVELRLAASLPVVMCDRIRLGQVLLNLLTNARQAMTGCPQRRLTIETRYRLDGDLPVEVSIGDTGCGFGPEQASRMFEPFFTTKAPGQGTGLGLSISDKIIKDHGGRITATGSPGGGATFTVSLPRAVTGAGGPSEDAHD